MMLSAANESRPDVGSSRKSTDGLAISEQAMVRRRFSPPLRPRTLMPPGSVPPTCVLRDRHRPIVSRTMRMRSSTSAAERRPPMRRRAWNWSVSSADIVGTNMSLWLTKADTRRKRLPTGLPFIQIAPSILPAGLYPERISRSVDLPAPEGPTMAHISPGTTAPVAGARICFGRSVLRSVTVQASLNHERSAG